MLEEIEEGIWSWKTGVSGPSVCIAFGTHGDERAPIEAGLALAARLRSGEDRPACGTLLLIHSNPRATAEGRRWSEGGIDLNRCYHPDVLAREPRMYEEGRARRIVAALEAADTRILVDFHCTAEPGRPFLMQHPPASEPHHGEIAELLRADVLLTDPGLNFGGVSLDEWMSGRGRVGICYETGWIGDPANTPEVLLDEMRNVLVGTGMLVGDADSNPKKWRLELDGVVLCDGDGFRWRDGLGVNLQELDTGTVLGVYADGREVALERDATLIFPKKKPELVQRGNPLVYLARKL